jgi:hypothetical protein
MAHAILAPSSAARWLVCSPSARLEEQFPDRAGEAAKEGTLAHSLGELLIKEKLKLVTPAKYKKLFAIIKADALYNEAMLEHSEEYAVFVIERYNEARTVTKDALLITEEKVDLTAYIPEAFGTVDNQIIADGTIEIIDLKYGKGLLVEAKDNRQMMLYALGVIENYHMVYDLQNVRMTIHQPRLGNYSSFEMSVADLKYWGQSELKPRAAMAFEGKGDFIAGKHCQFCRARAVCKANADYQLELAKYEFREPVWPDGTDLLEDLEVSDILSRAKDFKSWLTAVEEYALDQALNNNKKWPGFKLVEGRSNRAYSSTENVAKKLLDAGFAEDLIYKKELLGITAMEKEIGKKVFSEHLSELIIKPPGKPTLAPETDKRPEFNSSEAAAKDFSQIETDS